MMSTFDNAAPQPDWVPQPGRHCGQLCVDLSCPVCGEFVREVEPQVWLGEN